VKEHGASETAWVEQMVWLFQNFSETLTFLINPFICDRKCQKTA
jgi:hypothetical protein